MVEDECVWGLDEEETGGADGSEPCKVLMITLAKPPPTEEEVMWKKGGTFRCGCFRPYPKAGMYLN